MRIAELNNDSAAFQALFTKVPSSELDGGKAAKLLDMMLGYSTESFIDPATVKALYARTTGEAATTGINLTAAKAAHFLGDIKAALEHAKQAETENETGAASFVIYIKASSANNSPYLERAVKAYRLPAVGFLRK